MVLLAEDLDELFEEAWQLVELAAATPDRHLVPRLLELAEDIAVWRSQLESEAPDAQFSAGTSLLIEAPQGRQYRVASEDHYTNRILSLLDSFAANLSEMEARVSRQRLIVDRLERMGSRRSIEQGRRLLQLMEAATEITRRNRSLLETWPQQRDVEHFA
jgi:hypothetical protein